MHLDNRGGLRLTKKGLCIAVGSVLGVALIAWILLVVGIFRKDKKEEFVWTPPSYDIPEVPEGYQLVFKVKKEYNVSKYGIKTLSKSYEYDKNGNELVCCEYEGALRIYKKTEQTYDDQNRLLSYTETDSDGNVSANTTYTYDQSGNLIEYEHELDGYKASRGVYQYDADGICTNAVFYNSDGSIGSETVFYPGGNPQKEKRYLYTGVEETVYDEDYNVLICTMTDDEGTFVKEENTYSEDGVLLETIARPWRDEEERTVYYYDESGIRIKNVVWKNGKISSETLYQDGNITEIYHYREDGSRVLIAQYEYGDNGRITRTDYDDNTGGIIRKTVSRAMDDYEITEEAWIVGDNGELVPKYSIEYDEDGFEIALTYYVDGEVYNYTEYEYDNKDLWKDYVGRKSSNLASKTTVKKPNGEVEYYIIREFNAGRNTTKCMYYNPDGSYYDNGPESGYNGFTSEYDEYGNMVRQIVYHFGKVYEQTIIEYEPFAVPVTKE